MPCQVKGGLVQHFGDHIGDGHAAPNHLHDLLKQEGQAEGEQQFGHMAEAVHRPQSITFHQGTDNADQNRCDQQGGDEAQRRGNGVGEIGPEHEEAGMGKVQHPHHREDEGQSARQQE